MMISMFARVRTPRPDPIGSRPLLEAYLGGTPNQVPERYAAASPIEHVSARVPPTLLIYGSRDHIVEARYGRDLHARLLAVTSSCRPDMHEPDEVHVSARMIGSRLDNACGESVSEGALMGGYQELIVLLDKGASYTQTHAFNLADLIALARAADPEQVRRLAM